MLISLLRRLTLCLYNN